MKRLLEYRVELSVVLSLITGLVLTYTSPFPAGHWLVHLVAVHKPWLGFVLAGLYHTLLFTSCAIVFSAALSLTYVLIPAFEPQRQKICLPPLPARQGDLSVVVGEVHQARVPEPSPNPHWLVIPERGLFTGIAIIGAIGSGKTSCCMYPFAEQILSFGSRDAAIGGLVLEVKGDFCRKVRKILADWGRESDYVEINLSDSPYRYNPLHNDLDAYALAYGIATLLTSLFGRGREPFWQQAYTNMVKFIILLHRVLYDYVTLFDVYACAINPDLLKEKISEAEALLRPRKIVVVEPAIYLACEGLSRFHWKKNAESNQMEAELTPDMEKFLLASSILHEVREERKDGAALDEVKREQCQAIGRWFHEDWMRIEARLRTSIVEGVSFFLSLFDDNPAMKRVFCPPKEYFDPEVNGDGHLGKPLPPFTELIEQGRVVALNFPTSANPGLARLIGTLMKVDFQRAVLGRIQLMESQPNHHFRQVLFLCDEYHAFATVGEGDPTGDEKFFALSRQARCIPIVATQSISSLRSALSGETWRTLLQTFRTKIFLALSDDFSARVASDLCGRDDHLKLSYNLSESGQDAGVSMLTGRALAHRASITASKNYSVQRDNIFESRVFAELKNAQAVVLAYDGLNPLPPTYCYLKPYYLDPSVSYFDHLDRGAL